MFYFQRKPLANPICLVYNTKKYTMMKATIPYSFQRACGWCERARGRIFPLSE